ncbi:hypothetical protein [Sphingomonas crusticola]|uniref:hypothetical protein n=1 Tax=Sphingomonas crusticola TaxID=1697973 RepID=UPI0013C3000B|nr:hypothetical protein [Sphingomonas crusticola]
MSPQETEWIGWNGGSAPVAGDVMVEVSFRYGKRVVRAQGDSLRWSHDLYDAYGADDIVAYRIIATGSG